MVRATSRAAPGSGRRGRQAVEGETAMRYFASALAILLLASAAAKADLFLAPYGPGGTWKVYETVSTSLTWQNAQADAQTRVDPLLGSAVSGNLVTINSAAENNFVYNIVRRGGSWWAGGTDQAVDGEWRWASNNVQFWQGLAGGSPVGGAYTNWNGGEPNNWGGNEAYLEFTGPAGVWNDQGNSATMGYVVEYDTGLAALPATTGTVILNPTNGRYYQYVSTSQSWATGKAIAESRTFQGVPGRLIEINDAAEAAFARILTSDGYIGLTDEPSFSPGESSNNPTAWAWAGPVDPATGNFTYRTIAAAGGFTYWGTGEPNGGTGENHGQMRPDAQWNDLNGLTNNRTAIVEYDLAQAVPTNIRVRTVNGTSMGTGIGDIQNLMNGQSTRTGTAVAAVAAVNLGDPENANGQRFAGYAPFPNNTSADDNNFAVKAYATVVIPAAGDYTFGIQHDDQAQLVVDRGSDAAHVYTTAGQTGEHFTTVNFAAAGTYNVYLSFAEIGGGAQLELYAAPGSKTVYDSSFQLVGDTANGGLAAAPLRDISISGDMFTVRDAKSTGTINSLAAADALLAGTGLQSQTITQALAINYRDPDGGGGNGNFGMDYVFPNDTPGVNEDDAAVQATGTLLVPLGSEGWWTFGFNGDDGGRLRIDGIDVILDDTMHGPTDKFGSIYLTSGSHLLDFVFFERNGGEEVELFYAAGTHTGFNSSFDLLQAAPEPSAVVLLGTGIIALLALLVRRRR